MRDHEPAESGDDPRGRTPHPTEGATERAADRATGPAPRPTGKDAVPPRPLTPVAPPARAASDASPARVVPAEDAAAAADESPEVPAIAAEEEEVLKFPDHVVPPLAELVEAMRWAFAGEDTPVEPALLERFARHAELVLDWNRRVNLTAIVEPREVAAKHYLDSWRVTRLLSFMGRRVLDLGSGAGYPGIPIALAEQHAHVTLLDATRKRTEFLAECVRVLGLKNAESAWARAEDHLARNKYDIVVVRALSSVREAVRLLRKVRHSHKDLVLYKGPSWSREVRAAEREAERLGYRLDTVFEHELPGEMGGRAILVYRAPGGQGD